MTQAACERNQEAWNAAVARAGGGEVWEDAGLRWAWQAADHSLMLSFPATIDPAAAERGVAAARRLGAGIVGAWLNTDVDATPLEAAGFERGWEPWWMAAPLEEIAATDDDRVTMLAPPGPDTWHARAMVGGRGVGGAYAHLDAGVAGIYDMGVHPDFERRGLGRALLRTVCAAARDAGAELATLNATPAGEPLYASEGFVRVGTGITYWHHLG